MTAVVVSEGGGDGNFISPIDLASTLPEVDGRGTVRETMAHTSAEGRIRGVVVSERGGDGKWVGGVQVSADAGGAHRAVEEMVSGALVGGRAMAG